MNLDYRNANKHLSRIFPELLKFDETNLCKHACKRLLQLPQNFRVYFLLIEFQRARDWAVRVAQRRILDDRERGKAQKDLGFRGIQPEL